MKKLLGIALIALCTTAVSMANALKVTPLDDDRVAVDLTVQADSSEGAVQLARREAVRACVGQALLSGRLIMADDLLEKYLVNYGDSFIEGLEPLKKDFRAGVYHLDARVFVNRKRLIADLDDKRFIYDPAYKPQFATWFSERLNGQTTESGAARASVAKALLSHGLRAYDNSLLTPRCSRDVTGSEAHLKEGLVCCQRSGVEVLISGQASTSLREKKTLYFDEYWFYDTEVTFKVIRVDTAETLFEITAFGSASDTGAEAAIQSSIDRAADNAIKDLAPQFNKLWPFVVQDKADYEILLTGSEPDSVRIISKRIEQTTGGAEVYVRKTFDGSTMLTVVTKASREDLLDNIRSCPYPSLKVLNPEAKRVFQVQIAG